MSWLIFIFRIVFKKYNIKLLISTCLFLSERAFLVLTLCWNLFLTNCQHMPNYCPWFDELFWFCIVNLAFQLHFIDYKLLQQPVNHAYSCNSNNNNNNNPYFWSLWSQSGHTLGSVASGKINLKVLSDLTGSSVKKSVQIFFLQEQSFASLGSFLDFFLRFYIFFCYRCYLLLCGRENL